MFVHGIGNITLWYFRNKSYISTNGAIVCKKNYELTILLSILNAEKSQIKCEVTTVCDVDQARATFFGRGPHQYFDRMSGATRPESFTTDYHLL